MNVKPRYKMDIDFKTRQLYPAELRLLKPLKNQKEKEGISKINFYHFIGAALLGAGFTYLATLTKSSFWVLPLGTIAVFACAFIVFYPYEMYKQKKGINIFHTNSVVLLTRGHLTLAS